MDIALSVGPGPVQTLQLRAKELETDSVPVCMLPEVSGSCLTRAYNVLFLYTNIAATGREGEVWRQDQQLCTPWTHRERLRMDLGLKQRVPLHVHGHQEASSKGFHLYPLLHTSARERG